MKKRILYCGDDTLATAARYLGGVLKKERFFYDYLPSDARPSEVFLKTHYDLYILSDYPSRRFPGWALQRIAQNVRNGSSLLMIGGWGSFKGVDGNYHQTSLRNVLPVRLLAHDDRVQGGLSYRITLEVRGRYFRGLDFRTSPGIAGYNRVLLKGGARPILSVQTLGQSSKSPGLHVVKKDPLFVLGSHGRGQVGALMTDLAPHWVGGLVDWGKRRIRIQLTHKVGIEIGENYLKFVKELIHLML